MCHSESCSENRKTFWSDIVAVVQAYRVRRGPDGLLPFNPMYVIECRMQLPGLPMIGMAETEQSRASNDDVNANRKGLVRGLNDRLRVIK